MISYWSNRPGKVEVKLVMDDKLLVSEIFDQTLQGEGPSIGKPCCFLRTGGCPLRCGYCDSAYTWRFTDKHPHDNDIVYDSKEELTRISIEEVGKQLTAFDTQLIVISGGEPLLQSEKILKLIRDHLNPLTRIEIETAGTIYPGYLGEMFNVYFNVSPKLENSGNPKELRYKPGVLDQFAGLSCGGKAIFKFVVCNEQDLLEVEEIVNAHYIMPNRVYLMPEGVTTEVLDERMKWLLPIVVERGWNLTDRMHIRLFGNKRGT